MPETVAEVMLVVAMVAVEVLVIALIAAPKAVVGATRCALAWVGARAARQLRRRWPQGRRPAQEHQARA